MPETIVARVFVGHVAKDKTEDGTQLSETVYAYPVYSSDPESPNYSFSKATPGGQIQLQISNPAAFGFFELHGEYDVIFEHHTK